MPISEVNPSVSFRTVDSYAIKLTALGREVIDTPANRQAMPNADFSKWTSLPLLAGYLYGLNEKGDIPSGSLITVVTRDGETSFDLV